MHEAFHYRHATDDGCPLVKYQCKHRLTRAHREKQLKMSCQALHNAPPNLSLIHISMAYKSLKDIIDVIRESVDVIEILKPIYNFKASE